MRARGKGEGVGVGVGEGEGEGEGEGDLLGGDDLQLGLQPLRRRALGVDGKLPREAWDVAGDWAAPSWRLLPTRVIASSREPLVIDERQRLRPPC